MSGLPRLSNLVWLGFAAATALVVVGTASAFGTVRDHFLGTTAGSRIAFTSLRNASFDLYVMNADGSKQRRLTTPAFGFPPPAWSPNGRRIAFVSGPGACILSIHRVNFVSERNVGSVRDVDISVANADGSGLRRLTRGPGVDCAPVWSPDGQKIAFQRLLVRGERDKIVGFDFDVYVINADGSGEQNLTGDALSERPIWSPDGRKIAFWSGPDAAGGVYVMNADGSERRLLADGGARLRHQACPNCGSISHVAWSLDGRKILLVRDGPSGQGRNDSRKSYVVVMNADGGGQRRLTRTAADDAPTWSPDGRKIAFESYRDGNPEIYVMNADGSGQRNLTRNPGYDSDPAWSPDGKKIAFTTKREGNFEIYVMNADGSGKHNLTRNPAVDRYPVWSPGRKR
jgi:Tol biopolymer transport system component